MSTGAVGYGTTLSLGGSAVGQVVDVKVGDISTKAADISNNDSQNGAREFVPGLADNGEITFNVIAYTTNRAAIYALYRTTQAVVVTLPDTHTWTGGSGCFITKVADGVPLDDAQTLDITVKISGKLVYA